MPENYKILAVNDDPDQLELKEVLLLNTGFQVLTAHSGYEAYTVAQRERPDLIISDVLMPDGDGIELCRLIRADEKLRFIPILLVSALQKDTASVVQGLEAGADDYMELPYEPMRLIAKAARLIERKQVEDALRESENRFRSMIENLTDIISILAPDGTAIYESPSLEHILGYKPEELIGKNILNFIHPEDSLELIEYFASAMQTTEAASPIEYRFRHKNQSWRILESVGKPFNDPINGLVAVINSRDITEQRNALKAKHETENRLRIIFDNAAIGIALVNTKGQPIESNPALQKMLGYSGEELRRMSFAEFTHPDDLAEDLILAQEIFEGKRDYYQIEKRYIKKNGEIMWGNLTASVIRIDGETRFISGMVEDITDRRLAEAALRESEERFKAQYKGIPVPTFTWRRKEEDFVLADFNGAAEKITQNNIKNYLGTKASEFLDNSPEVLKNINRCFNEKTTVQHETLHRLKTTEESKHLDISYVFVPPDMVMMHSSDVTEQRQAEESLRESENRFQLVSRATNDALWDWDLLTDSLWMNEGGYRLLGYQLVKSESQIDLWFDAIHPDDRERVINGAHAVIKSGEKNWADEYRLILVDGSCAHIYDRGYVVYDDTGKPVRMIGAAIDITERKRVQEQLDHFFNVSVDLLCFVGFDGYFKRINPAWEKLLGYNEDELLSKPFIEFVHPDDREYTLKEAQGNFKGQKTISFENRYLCRDGSYKWLLWNSATIRDEQMIYAVAHDITERKQMENALRESKEHLALAQQAARIGSFELNLQTMQATSSAALETLYGVSPEELSYNYDDWAKYVHPEDLPKAKQELDRALSSGKHNAEFRILQSDGSVRWIFSTGKVFYDEVGVPQRLVGVNMDVTERKLAESTLRHNAEMLRQAQKLESVGRLAGGIAHDFNNMLTVINGYSGIILRQLSQDDPLRSKVEEIKKAGDRSASLTHQLLAFSRQQILKPKVLDINEVIIDTSKMLHRLIGEDIQLNILPNPKIGRVEVDPGQLTQVIMNLAVNARDAMPDGGSLIIETSNVELDERYAALHVPTKPGSYVMLAVTDTGSGMDNETIKQIFEPFFTTKEVGKGTGLGLSTVYGIVKQSGGYIWVYSKLGKGTTFKIYFPRVDEEVKEDKNNSAFENVPFGNETILLVEDEESVRDFARETLETCGYKVIEARNGEEALSIYKKSASKIDLLITDVVMPKMGGRKLAEEITRINSQIPQLFMSGYTDDTIIRQGMIAEDMTFIQKPFTFEILAHKVRELLDKK